MGTYDVDDYVDDHVEGLMQVQCYERCSHAG